MCTRSRALGMYRHVHRLGSTSARRIPPEAVLVSHKNQPLASFPVPVCGAAHSAGRFEYRPNKGNPDKRKLRRTQLCFHLYWPSHTAQHGLTSQLPVRLQQGAPHTACGSRLSPACLPGVRWPGGFRGCRPRSAGAAGAAGTTLPCQAPALRQGGARWRPCGLPQRAGVQPDARFSTIGGRSSAFSLLMKQWCLHAL